MSGRILEITPFFMPGIRPRAASIVSSQFAYARFAQKNVALNRVKEIDLTYAEFGCSDRKQSYRLAVDAENLGRTRLVQPADETEAGLVTAVSLDSVLLDQPISFIKIDVEGMELDVLAGAKEIIAQYRPGYRN